MNAAASCLRRFSRWIDDVAAGLDRLGAALRRGRKLELAEQADGGFVVTERRHNGARLLDEPRLRLETDDFEASLSARMRHLFARSRVEVWLAPSRFVMRTLELPRGANPFLDGVVRSQIDRLTPWSASEAAFGWSPAVDAGADRIAVTVAATASQQIAPLMAALVAVRVDQIRMSTRTGDRGEVEITVLARRSGGKYGALHLRRALLSGLTVSVLALALSLGAWAFLGMAYETRLAELQNRIEEGRAALLNRRSGAAGRALQILQTRKRRSPSAVMTLEALSKALPDDTHLTELRIEDGKVQIVGVSADAPALVRLIEGARQFTRATFFAPTFGGQAGETFHIEAHLEPSFGATE